MKMIKNELYWLWLANIKGIGRKKTEALLECFLTPERLFAASETEIKEVFAAYKSFRQEDLSVFLNSRDIMKIEAYDKKLADTGIEYISIDQERYPKQLKNIYDPPFIFYFRGVLPEEEGLKIAIVGARKCSPYGKKVAEYLGRMLAKNDIVVVSGMARGIDTAAHQGALVGGGKTISVLGCGVNICYPQENLNLMKAIIKQGCVLSETPVSASPLAGNFPLRNRIISGLCDGVIIVEAAAKSGSLITSDSALEQGKDVFAVPGRIFDQLSEGTNQLIKMGAKPVLDIEDILEEYMELPVKSSGKESVLVKNLDKIEKEVYSCISLDPLHIDAICRLAKVSINDLQLVLMKLELVGMIEQLPNKYFVKKV